MLLENINKDLITIFLFSKECEVRPEAKVASLINEKQYNPTRLAGHLADNSLRLNWLFVLRL